MSKQKTYDQKHLTTSQRIHIEKGLNDGLSFAAIATVTMRFVEDEWVYGYILSFGENAIVLEPQRIRNMIKNRLAENLKKYLEYDAMVSY